MIDRRLCINMAAAEIQVVNPSNLAKIERFVYVLYMNTYKNIKAIVLGVSELHFLFPICDVLLTILKLMFYTLRLQFSQ